MKKGFTLIELLVVVLIIGILSAVALPQYEKVVDKSRASELFALVKNLKEQQELFYLANGRYAENCEEIGADLPAGFIETGTGGYYNLRKGNSYIQISCQNGSSVSTEGRAYGYVSSGSFNVNIETFFDHITSSQKAGRSFCFASNGNKRGMFVCKSFGKEKHEDNSYWL